MQGGIDACVFCGYGFNGRDAKCFLLFLKVSWVLALKCGGMFVDLVFMNKGRRNEIANLKRKKRIKLYRANPDDKWTNLLKNHTVLCSCFFCSHKKYNRAKYNAAADKVLRKQYNIPN